MSSSTRQLEKLTLNIDTSKYWHIRTLVDIQKDIIKDCEYTIQYQLLNSINNDVTL
jgi:hypothetical protein